MRRSHRGEYAAWLKQSKPLSATRWTTRKSRRCISKIIALIAAGYFFDVIDFTILGSLVPYMHAIQVRDRRRSRRDRQRHHLRHVHRHRRPGPVQRPVRPPVHLSVQPAAVRRLHDPRRASPRASRCWSSAASSPASASAPSSRSPSPMPANIRPRRIRGRILAIVHFIGGACVWPIGTALCSCSAASAIADHVWRGVWIVHRHRRADRLGVPLHAAGIAALSRDARQRQGSARRARPARHRRADGAADDRRREQHQERSVRASCSACSRSASSPA